jgi:hypothetical protein
MIAMADELRVRDESGLPEVVNRIHDFWFDLQRIHFDETAGVLRIDLLDEDHYRVLRSKPVQDARADLTLRLAHVESVDIRDTERVGFYDVNSITYDPNAKKVTISTGIPLEFHIRVSALDLELRRGDSP